MVGRKAGRATALLETAADIQQGAIARAPVDDGDLESAIKLPTSGLGTPEVEAVIYVDTSAAPHAYRLHENVLNPFVQPPERSFDDNWRKAVEGARAAV